MIKEFDIAEAPYKVRPQVDEEADSFGWDFARFLEKSGQFSSVGFAVEKQAETKDDGKDGAEEQALWFKRLEQANAICALVFAISLPISLTVSEVIFFGIGLPLCSGIFLATMIRRKAASPAIIAASVIAPLTFPLLLVALAITLSSFCSHGSVDAAWRSLYSLKNMLPYFWAFDAFRRSKSMVGPSVLMLLLCSSVAGIWGSIQQLFNIHPGFKWLQGTGFHGYPMPFAGQMQLFSMLSLGLLISGAYKVLSSRTSWPAFQRFSGIFERTDLFVAIVIANFAGLFFAGEKSAWLGGFAGVIAVCLLKSFRLALKSLAGLAGLSALSYFFVPLVKTRIDTMIAGRDPSLSARHQIWSECLNHYFPKSPITGIGWLDFPHFKIAEALVPGSKDLDHAHSNYIQFLTTTGIIGLASYLILIGWTFKSAISKFLQSQKENEQLNAGIAMGLFGAAVALAVSGFFEFNFGTAQVRLAQWFLFGLI